MAMIGMRAGLAAIVCSLSITAMAADKRRPRHHVPGEFHGYHMTVSDRASREVLMTLRGTPDKEMRELAGPGVSIPYSIYGIKETGASAYRLGIVRYSRDNAAGCSWTADPQAKSSLERCTPEQIRAYTAMLEHAIDDIVR